MEFQERGACHFHAIIDQEINEEELKRIWYEIVGSDDSRHRNHGAHVSPIRSSKGIRKYLSSYLTKQEQKTVPSFYANAGRFWGYSRSLINVVVKVVIGTPEELRIIRRNFRLFKRWQKANYRKWNKGAKYPKKMRKINPYAYYLPGEYITITDARDLITRLKGTPLDDSLFEGWGDASGL